MGSEMCIRDRAVEMAMWSLLGPRGVDMLGWESFGISWVSDAADQLQITPLVRHQADYGDLPDLSKVISTMMLSLPGMEPRRACGSRMGTGSPMTGPA